MLWHKAWLDTRWRFLIGLGLLLFTAIVNVLAYPSVPGILRAAARAERNGLDAGDITAAAQLATSFRGYIWIQFVHENLYFLWTLFAALLGATRPFLQRSDAVFTFSLPISRRRLFAVSAATDLVELSGLALIPLLLIVLMASVVGQTYALADALVHAIHVFVGGAVFYGTARLLATVFDDRWKQILIPLTLGIVATQCARLIPMWTPFNPASVMVGESYFRTGVPAWMGLFVWLGVATAILYISMRLLERRDL